MKRRLFIATGAATLSAAVAARYLLPREAPPTRVIEDYLPASALWFSLMTSRNAEADFGSYKRARVPRTAEFWRVLGEHPENCVELIKPIDWARCTGGFNLVTHFGIHATESISEAIFSGPVTPNVGVFTGVTFRMASALVSRS